VFDAEAVDEGLAGGVEEVVVGLLDEGLEELFSGFAEGLAEDAAGYGYSGGGERATDGEGGEGGEAHAPDG
jgi:hypothetical protein